MKGLWSSAWREISARVGRDAWFEHKFMWPLGCISGSVAGEFPWELSEFPSVPHFRRGWRWVTVATSEFHSGRRAFRTVLGRASPGRGVQRGLRGGSGFEAEGTAISAAQDPRRRDFGDVPRCELHFTPAPPAPGGTCCWRNGRAAATTTEDPPSPPPGPHGGPFTLETSFGTAPFLRSFD